MEVTRKIIDAMLEFQETMAEANIYCDIHQIQVSRKTYDCLKSEFFPYGPTHESGPGSILGHPLVIEDKPEWR